MADKTLVLCNVEVDLVDIIHQAVNQVWGSDERELLYTWLGRNTQEQQIVKIDLTIRNAGSKGKKGVKGNG